MTHDFVRRDILRSGAALSVLSAAGGLASCGQAPVQTQKSSSALQSMTGSAVPISADERQSRIAKAQTLMHARGIGALIVEAGSALTYFTGIKWWRSERFTGAVITADGDFCIVTPFFEEPSIREQMAFGQDVRTWHEHESPFALVSGYLRETGADAKPLAIEETVRHFIVGGIRDEAPQLDIVSGKSITRGCRMFKSPAEIALMQTANDVTMAAYRHVYGQVEVGMTPNDISALMNMATTQLGGAVQFSMALIGPASAYPHGTRQAQVVSEGDIILMDCGCAVHDYESDISRTWVMGEATKKQREVWDTVKRGQELASATMIPGNPAGTVDDAVRRYYESLGYGPEYAAPGLTHRLGHGIGMDGHEPVNFVSGETALLAPGMCFSNEPGIYIPGEFGVRLEDCLYMSEEGPVLFTPLSESIDNPMNLS